MSNKFTPNPRTYAKRNFGDLLETVIPELYLEEDLTLSGQELNPLSRIINTNLRAANNISQVLSISAVPNSSTSSIDNISGISPYFVKQNELTKVTPYSFDSQILVPLNTTLAHYDTSTDFNNFLSGTLLPAITLTTGSQGGGVGDNIAYLSGLTGSTDGSSIHNYLIDKLGWFYFLNTSAGGGLNWEPSGYVLSSLNSLYLGNELETVDGIKGFENFIWRNYATCTVFSNLGLIDDTYVSGATDAVYSPSAGGIPATYTSGTQKLENLLTLIDVIYSPLYIDQQDFTVKDAFDSYIGASTELVDFVSKGPLRKFLTGLGFSMADVTDQVEKVGLIYDIENAESEHLQYLAELIGFKLWGGSAFKWRQQLREAVNLQKKKGTLNAIQFAVDHLIVDSVLDVSGRVQELWESYIPHLIWYSLATESPYFRDLTTWTPGLAVEAGVFLYNTSSLEGNLKLVTDSILLDLYKKFPSYFLIAGEPWPTSKLYELDDFGDITKLYTITNEPGMKPFHVHRPQDGGYEVFKRQALERGQIAAWEASHSDGPLGYGVYMAEEAHPDPAPGATHLYLSATGDLTFFFNYRNHVNYPIPPFEEIKYYKDCSLNPGLVSVLRERLECFGVPPSFASSVESFILDKGITDDTNLGSLNDFLMFFSSVQTPPNYNDVVGRISEYQNNLLGLWNGKSSHLFLDFDNTDFDFAKTTYEGDSKYALYNASRVAKTYSPGHSIVKTNLNASALDPYDISSTRWSYLSLDKDDNFVSYGSGSVLAGFEFSGLDMGGQAPGTKDGRGGLNTFQRTDVDNLTTDPLLNGLSYLSTGATGRRAIRRRNFRYTLPTEGYYDRTGFNSPHSWDPSTIEYSMFGKPAAGGEEAPGTPTLASGMGENTLGYVPSAGKFFPIVDPINPSGVWHACEDLNSTRAFSGVITNTTFPYRGLSALGSNAKWDEFSASTARYVDRGQIPPIYITMHKFFDKKASFYADLDASTTPNSYWKNEHQSYMNSAIASGLVLNSFDDYRNFAFGRGVQDLNKDYNKYFLNPLGAREVDETGGNIFAQVFGKGLYNCDFSVEGSAVVASGVDYIASSVDTGRAIDSSPSGVFSKYAVASYVVGIDNVPASGTYIASGAEDCVVPLSGYEFVSGAPYNGEFRNPHILSGVEFCNTSGSPIGNAFYIFNIDKVYKKQEEENYLIGNPVIKCKTAAGLPRIRFDLSSYGKRRNYFIKNHKFKLKIKALIAEENSPQMGGGQMGVWIHTQPIFDPLTGSGYMWSWTSKGKWEMQDSYKTAKSDVISYSHLFGFPPKQTPPGTETFCLFNTTESVDVVNNVTLNNIRDEYFDTFELNFDTRNYTIYNNYEHQDIIPIPDRFYKLRDEVHRDDTNYIVEIFFMTPAVPEKYMLIDTISLEDSTQRDNAGIRTGTGVPTLGTPLRPFVTEDRLDYDKDQLRDTLKFFKGLSGSGTGLYATNLAGRDWQSGPNVNASLEKSDLGVSGGSRLNYRLHPQVMVFAKQSSFNNYTLIQTDN